MNWLRKKLLTFLFKDHVVFKLPEGLEFQVREKKYFTRCQSDGNFIKSHKPFLENSWLNEIHLRYFV